MIKFIDYRSKEAGNFVKEFFSVSLNLHTPGTKGFGIWRLLINREQYLNRNKMYKPH